MSWFELPNRRKERAVAPAAAAMSDYSHLLDTPLGQALLYEEKQLLQSVFTRLVGCNCLQLSAGKGLELCNTEAVGQALTMGYGPGRDGDDQFWADYQSFPVAHDCIDIVLLHHVLEYSSDPTEVLREADRTLTAGGYLLVLGFNPLSAWPVYQTYWRKKYKLPAHAGKLIPAGRLEDWLTALNYEVLKKRRLFSRFPVNNELWLKRTQGIERLARYCRHPFGVLNFTLARKKTVPLNPVFNHWRQAALGAKSPTVGSISTGVK